MNSSFSSWFRGIKGKLLFAAILPVIGFIIIYTISFSSMGKLSSMLDVANKDTIPNLASVGEMRQARNKFGYQIFAAMAMPTEEKRHARVKLARDGIKEFEENFKIYSHVPSPPQLADSDKKAAAVIEEYLALLEKTAKLAESGKPEAYEEVKSLLDGRLWELGTIMNQMTTTAIKFYKETAEQNTKLAESTKVHANNLIILTTGVSGFAIFGILLFIAARLASSVGFVANRLTNASTNVSSSVEQLSEAGNSLSQSSTEAAASLEETVAALEELTSMVQMNSDNAKQAAALSVTSRDAAESGEREIKSLITSMTEISQSSKKIEEIISVIDDIAFQTNLLALNAAVEAARAGEQGKGFAVVAEAVRALAQRSASSAKDISSLIKDSVEQIGNGSKIAGQSGTVLANIVSSIKKVSDLNNEIAAASSEQTTGIQQISKAMNQLDQASQSNAASAEEIAATSGEINTLAVTASSLTVELNELVLGTSESSAPLAMTTEKPLAAKASPAPKAKVLPLRKPTPLEESKKSSESVIPFDEDQRAKVGTTDGF